MNLLEQWRLLSYNGKILIVSFAKFRLDVTDENDSKNIVDRYIMHTSVFVYWFV